jgi:hypothetical protein
LSDSLGPIFSPNVEISSNLVSLVRTENSVK